MEFKEVMREQMTRFMQQSKEAQQMEIQKAVAYCWENNLMIQKLLDLNKGRPMLEETMGLMNYWMDQAKKKEKEKENILREADKPTAENKSPETLAEADKHSVSKNENGCLHEKSSSQCGELPHKQDKKSDDGNDMVTQMAMDVQERETPSPSEEVELKKLGFEFGADFVNDGAVKFADFFKTMVENFGDGIRPYTKTIYSGIQAEVADEVLDQMDDINIVRAFDISVDIETLT